MEQNAQNRRLPYPDALRVFAMVFVMLIHTAATGYTLSAEGSYAWTVCLIYNAAARFAVPVFVMISGALYLDPRREVTVGHMLRKTARLALIFLAWSLVYALAESAKEYALLTPEYRRSVLEKTLRGHYHMWYLYLLAGLHLAVPLLRIPARRPGGLWAVTAVAFLLGLLPAGMRYAAYAGYFCLGYLLHKADISGKTAAKLLCLAAAVFLAALPAGIAADRPQRLLQESMPHVWLGSAAVFLFFKTRAEKPCRFVETVAPCGLGMYLAHPMANFLLRGAGLHAVTFDPLLCVPLCTLLVFAISFCTVRIMRKIPLIRLFA